MFGRKSKDDTDKDKDKKKKKKKKKKKIDPNSRTFRFRKFLNSKLAKSSLGRKAIGHFLGEAGNTTLELIKAIVTKQNSKKAGTDVHKSIIHFALKGKLMHDARLITQKDVLPLVDPINFVLVNFYETLRDNDPASDESDPQGINRNLVPITRSVLDLLKPHMTAKNLKIAEWLFSVLINVELLKALFTSERLKAERRGLVQSLSVVLAPIINLKDDRNACSYSSCHDPLVSFIVTEAKDFRGLNYCANHHRKVAIRIVENPSLDHFITEDKTFEPFLEFMEQNTPKNALAFLKGTGNYSRANRRTRKPFCVAVWEKYLDDTATHRIEFLPDEVMEQIQKEIPEPTPDTYARAEGIARTILESAFKAFLLSSGWATYKKLIQLPHEMEKTYMVSDLAKKTGETIRLSVDLDEDDVSLAEMEMLARLEGEQQSNADDEVKEES